MFGETAAYNLLILTSFILAGIFMYYLARHLTGSKPASFLAGIAYAFCPYHLMHAQVHVNLSIIQWMPLFLLCLYLLIEKRTWPRATMTGLTFSLVMLSDFHYGLFTTMLATIILAVELFSAWRGQRLRKPAASTLAKLALIAAIIVLIVAPFVLTLMNASKNEGLEGRSNTTELLHYSARPWDYILPPADNPILGKFTSSFINSHSHGAEDYEVTNYLGFVVAIMAIAGLILVFGRKARRRRRESEPRTRVTEARRNRVIISMATGAAMFFVLSLPPQFHLGSMKIYLPSVFLQKALPLLRCYSRFGVMVLLCIVVIASYGITFLLRRKVFASCQALVVTVLAMLIILEFAIVPPFKYIETKPIPPLYTYLAKQKFAGGIAYYPMDNAGWYMVSYLFWQRVTQKPMLNGGNLINPVEKKYQYLMDILHPDTPEILAALGIKKAVVVLSQWQKASLDMVPGESSASFPTNLLPVGYRVEKEFANGLVLDITAPLSVFVPRVKEGLEWPVMITGGRYVQWCNPRAQIVIENNSRETRDVSLALDAVAPTGHAKLDIRLNGSPAGTWELNAEKTHVRIERINLKPGNNDLVLLVALLAARSRTGTSVPPLAISPLYINDL